MAASHIMIALSPLNNLRGREKKAGLAEAKEILTITLSKKFSAAYAAALPGKMMVRNDCHIEAVAVEDATTPDDPGMLAERLKDVPSPQPIHRSEVSPVAGAHVGPRVLAVPGPEAD